MGDVPITRVDLNAQNQQFDDLTTQIKEILEPLLQGVVNNGHNEQ